MAFDSVLVVSFGGPQGPEDIRPFLARVLRGRRASAERVEEVVRHYESFGGISPLTALTQLQAKGLGERLSREGIPLPVFVGMRNWKPLLADTLAEMVGKGHRRAIGFITAAHPVYSSCGQYKHDVLEARAELSARGLPDLDVVFTDGWHTHPGFVRANAERVIAARGTLPKDLRAEAKLLFTAHSVPSSMPGVEAYREALALSAKRVAGAVNISDFGLVYQSRSGRPEDPWLGPDINDALREEARAGRRAVLVSPLGFVCDHIEVLYDLDHEAMNTARGLGMVMARAKAVNAAPPFLDAMADAVRGVWTAHQRRRVLPLAVSPRVIDSRRTT